MVAFRRVLCCSENVLDLPSYWWFVGVDGYLTGRNVKASDLLGKTRSRNQGRSAVATGILAPRQGWDSTQSKFAHLVTRNPDKTSYRRNIQGRMPVAIAAGVHFSISVRPRL